MNHRFFAITASIVLGATAWSQAPGQRTTPGGGPDDGVLAGPKVADFAPRLTLVRRDFSGHLERLEMPPEEASLALLKLSPDEKQNTKLVLTERSTLMDKAVSNNIPMLLKLQGFKQATQTERLAMLREWAQVLRPLRDHGKLADELAAGLSPENAASMRAMAEEYWNAVIEDGMRPDTAVAMNEDKPKGPRLTRAQSAAKEYLLALGGEIKRSYDRIISSRTAQLEDALNRIDATDEQRDKIKALGLEYFQKTLGKATPEQKRDHMQKVLATLRPEQKVALLRDLYGK